MLAKITNVHGASVIESSHAGQDKYVHVLSASMIEASRLGKIIAFMFLVHPGNNSPTGPRACFLQLSRT